MKLSSDAAMESLLLATKARAAVLWSHATPPSRALAELLRRSHHTHHSTSSLRHLAIGPSSFLLHLDQLHELLAHAHTADYVAVDRSLGSPRRVTSEERAELLAAFVLLLERLQLHLLLLGVVHVYCGAAAACRESAAGPILRVRCAAWPASVSAKIVELRRRDHLLGPRPLRPCSRLLLCNKEEALHTVDCKACDPSRRARGLFNVLSKDFR